MHASAMRVLEQPDLVRQQAPSYDDPITRAGARNEAEFVSAVEKESDRVAEQMEVESKRRLPS